MKQILYIMFKDGSRNIIYCEHFTFTSVGVLVISYENHIDEINMNDIRMFGGWSDEAH